MKVSDIPKAITALLWAARLQCEAKMAGVRRCKKDDPQCAPCIARALVRDADGPMVCRRCGCTDDAACIGGCWWVAGDLCSSCVGRRPRRRMKRERAVRTR